MQLKVFSLLGIHELFHAPECWSPVFKLHSLLPHLMIRFIHSHPSMDVVVRDRFSLLLLSGKAIHQNSL